MYRQQSSRNHRSKGGIKLKNVFQVCLLLAICIWLLYQMKHSRDKKKELEEQYTDASYKVHESPSEISRFGRKDLPDTVVKDFKGETRIDEEENDEVEEASHEEHRGSMDQKMNGRDQDNAKEKFEQKEQVANSEGKKSHVEDHEHEDASSHEAREKSFKGDDASSEVLQLAQVVPEHEEGHESGEASHSTQKAEHKEGSNDERNGQEVEHENGSHEARERSFKGDDVSSAVDHKPLKDSELGSGVRDFDEKISDNADREDNKIVDLLDETTEDSEGNHKDDTNIKEQLHSFVENNSSFVHGNTETQHKDDDSAIEASPEKKEPEVVLTEVADNLSLSNTTTAESGNQIMDQLDQKNLSTIDNQKELQVYFSNYTSDNQTSLYTSSSDFSKNQENIQMNATAGSQEKLQILSNEKHVVDPTTNLTPEQNQTTAFNPPQEPNYEIKNEVPQNDKSDLEQVTTEQKPSLETVVPRQKPEENHNSSSVTTTNDTVKEAPVESSNSNNSLHNGAAGKETQPK